MPCGTVQEIGRHGTKVTFACLGSRLETVSIGRLVNGPQYPLADDNAASPAPQPLIRPVPVLHLPNIKTPPRFPKVAASKFHTHFTAV